MHQKTTSKTIRPLAIGIGFQQTLVPDEDTLYDLGASPDEDTERHSILVLAVDHVFPSDSNRIVYEADVTPDCFSSNDSVARLIKPVGSGFSAALGFVGARDRLLQKHNVVLVANALSTGSILQQLDRRGVEDLNRCVIVAPISTGDPDCQHQTVLRRFEARGGQVINLTTTENVLTLTAGLERAANHTAACLVLIDPRIAPAWQMVPDSRIRKTTLPSKETVAERVLLSSVSMEIARYTRDDRRSTPVLFELRRPWQKLVEEFGRRVLAPGDQEIDESLAWCAALAQGGCHPIVILNSRQLTDHMDALQKHVFPLKQRATIFVLDSVTTSINAIESLLAPLLTDVHVVLPGTPDEVIPLVKTALRAEWPRLIYLPIASDLFCVERDRWLDFRAAASLRERAGKKTEPSASPLMLDSPERESRQIFSRQLTPEAESWLNDYHTVGERGLVSWRRVCHAIQLLELPSVAPEWRRRNRDTKFLAAMFNVLLEDVAGERDSKGLLQQLMRLPQGGRPDIPHSDRSARYATLTSAVWDELWRRAAEYPRYEEFTELLRYDFWQLCNTIEYTDLVLRQPEMTNTVEHAMYSPHGMLVTCAATLDLMCSPRFDANQLGPLREALWHAACMAQYGDLLTARRRGEATGEMMPEPDAQQARFDAVQREFLNRWQIHRTCVLNLRERASSCFLRSYVEGLDRLLTSEFAAVRTHAVELTATADR